MSSVDVVVPCYNYGRYLEECVSSVLSQEAVTVRVLIIDDCSTDATPDIGRRLAERDPRVTFTRHDQNKGHTPTYNEGLLDWTTADYALLLSADDLLTPGALRRSVTVMDRHDDIGLSYGVVIRLTNDERPNLTEAVLSDDYRVIQGRAFLAHCCRTGMNPVETSAAVVRTATQKRAGGYRADLPHTGDMEMWMRFAAIGPVGVSRATQGFYRWHSRNMSHSYRSRSVLGDLPERARAFRAIFETFGSEIQDVAELRELWARSLGTEAFRMAQIVFERGDASGFLECLRFVEGTYPGAMTTREWKFRVKTALGIKTWHRVRPVLDRIRRRKEPRFSQSAAAATPSRTSGWWPG